jgi:hypothetical protein
MFEEKNKLLDKKGEVRIFALILLAIVILSAIFIISGLEKQKVNLIANRTSLQQSNIEIEKAKNMINKYKIKTLKVSFWKIDRQNLSKGEFLGTAILKNGKLLINVKDQDLKEILQKPYNTMRGEVKKGVARDWLVTYQPGTPQHLRAIATECWQWGYIGKIEKGN